MQTTRMTPLAAQLRIGSNVWVRSGHYSDSKRTIYKVKNITKTQTVTENAFGEMRFMLGTLREVGSLSKYKAWVEAIATDAEFAEWDGTEGAQERETARTNKLWEDRRKRVRCLEATLPEGMKPKILMNGNDEDSAIYKLELNHLTEEQLQKVAAAIRQA